MTSEGTGIRIGRRKKLEDEEVKDSIFLIIRPKIIKPVRKTDAYSPRIQAR